MFETSHVRARAAAQRRYGLLTVSLAVHTAVIAGVIGASVSSLSLPVHAPNELPVFRNVMPVVIPPPLGRRDVPRTQTQTAAQPAVRRATPAPAIVAPQHIPDAIPAVTSTIGDQNQQAGPPSAGPYGDEHGVPGGIDLDQPPLPIPQTPAPPVILHAGGAVKSAAVVRRVDPVYPRAALMSHLPGKVVLECVIDKDGSIRDARVISSTMAIFDQPALDALRQWTFTPGSLHGQPVDTYFELTVTFQPR